MMESFNVCRTAKTGNPLIREDLDPEAGGLHFANSRPPTVYIEGQDEAIAANVAYIEQPYWTG